MVDRMVNCVVDGDTFLGSFVVVAVHEEEAVMVRYKRAHRSAKIADQKPEAVARTLLHALVREDIARGTRPILTRVRPADAIGHLSARLGPADTKGMTRRRASPTPGGALPQQVPPKAP